MDYSFSIPASHPSLKGHFPGNPVVPGVVILDEVINIVASVKPGYIVSAIPTVKFTQPLLPEQIVDVILNEKSDTRISFSCKTTETSLVTGQLTLKSLA